MVALLRQNLATIPPRSSVELNWTHPLARGLKFFPLFAQAGHGFDLVNRIGPTTLGTGQRVGPLGGTMGTSSTSNAFAEWSGTWVTSQFASGTELSLAVMFTPRAALNLQGVYLNLCNAAGSNFNILGNSTLSSVIGMWIQNTNYAITGFSTMAISRTYMIVYSGGATSSRVMAFSAEGGIIADRSLPALGTLAADLSRIRIGNERGSSTGGAPVGSFSPLGETHYTAIWNRRLSNDEMVELGSEPYAFLLQQHVAAPSSPRSPFRGWGIQLAA
tara:strand:- start:17 stop:838 length:822 start_codon:yes stop_codon:yes gene_type:complete